jgi:hypothetical protein
MGDVVNLKRFKKQAARDQASQHAEINRARYGRTKAERQRDEQHARKSEATLDQHRLGGDES